MQEYECRKTYTNYFLSHRNVYARAKESESESEIFYLTIIHVQFIMKVIHLLNTEVNDDFC